MEENLQASLRDLRAGTRVQEHEKHARGENLGPTVNLQGTYNFFLLQYGREITCGKFIEVPTPTIVMKRVVEMALTKKQKEGMIF